MADNSSPASSRQPSLEQVQQSSLGLYEASKTFVATDEKQVFGTFPPFLAAADALTIAASTPSDYATNLIRMLVQTAIIQTILSLNVLDSIPEEGSISLKDLAHKSGVQDALLERLLRVLVGAHVLTINSGDEYVHTRVSLGLKGPSGRMLSHCYNATALPLLHLPRYLAARGPTEPTSVTHNPMTWSEGQEGKTPFEIISKMPSRVQGMHEMMVTMQTLRPYTGFYDYSQLYDENDAERIVFVDVGGGNGHVVQAVLEEYPKIRPEQCVLQDRAEVLDMARTGGRLNAAVQLMQHDYFQPQPVSHARAYHLRAVAHDLGDEKLAEVLRQIVPVMAPDSKVLIAECIVADRDASALVGMMDVMMLAIGGKERTEKNFREVLERVGLQVDAVHRANDAGWGIVEASLKA